MNTIQLSLIKLGYEAYCEKISNLSRTRLLGNLLQHYQYLAESEYDKLIAFCEKRNINIFQISDKERADISQAIIEQDIKVLLKQKKEFDAEINSLKSKYPDECKELDLETKQLTNGIEQCELFKLFGSPINKQWLTKRSNLILSNCQKNINYERLSQRIELLQKHWDDINPQQLIPDKSKYLKLYGSEVPIELKELVAKSNGN